MIDYLKTSLLWLYQLIFNKKAILRSKKFWESNKNKHKGERVFIVCNGPSLNYNDLDLLSEEFTIACNKIYLAYDNTNWRPTYLSVTDRILWPKISKEIFNLNSSVILTSNLFSNNDQSIFIKTLGYFKNYKKLNFSFDMNYGAFSGLTVTYLNLQIAAHLGFKEIFLIGCDHFYEEENIKSKGSFKNMPKTVEHNKNNHFHPDYRKKGEKVNYADIALMTEAYENAKKELSKKNIKVYNASRKTSLNTFEKVNLDMLFTK